MTWPLLAIIGCAALLLTEFRPGNAENPSSNNLKKIARLYRTYEKGFKSVESISTDETEKLLESDDAILIDVRTEEEREVSIIPGAIDMETFRRNAANLKNREVILYCTIGYRSGIRARQMAATNVFVKNLKGGILAWVNTGKAVVNDDGPTRKVHVYGEKWDILPFGYKAIMFDDKR